MNGRQSGRIAGCGIEKQFSSACELKEMEKAKIL